jgi:hypothetical protein
MTVTTASGKTIHLHFVHSSHDGATRPGAGAQRQELDAIAFEGGRRLTLCDVSQVTYSGDSTGDNDTENYMLLGQGISICHPNDTFKKPVGRKIALTHALLASGDSLDKLDRADIWDAYRAQFGDVQK